MPEELKRQLWNIANELRGKMSADEFKNYILWFIFYKYLSEKLLTKANELLKNENISYNQIDEKSKEGQEYLQAIKEDTIETLGYFLKPSELFSEITKKWNHKSETEQDDFILSDLTNILRNIEQSTIWTESEEDFIDLFEDLDLTHQKLGKTTKQKNELISKILSHLDKIDFKTKDIEVDILWDAYEFLIAKFASGAWKQAWEFYTPQEVSQILSKLVTTHKSQIKSVYDPTCGSGSLLLRVAKEVDNRDQIQFFWQELNRTTYNLARMNMILHNIRFSMFNIEQEDTLEHPEHLEKRFEAIVANPPFSADWSANNLHLSDDRFSQYGKLAPRKRADYAFITHMIHHLDENGTMAVVVNHWVLSRWNAEWHIRRYLIENRNYLDAVIGLPRNIFHGTEIFTCILVFKKCRKDDENILFIDASNDFLKDKNKNRLRPQDRQKIIETYKYRKQIEKYSHIASLKEIAENDYNLNIPRYVDSFEEEEQVNLGEVADEITKLDNESEKLDEEIKGYCKELGIKKSFLKK